MSKFSLTKQDRYCGTCEYWQGSRSVQYYGSMVEFNSINDSAKCIVPSTGMQWGPNGVNHSACQFYKKWGAVD